jgi:peptidoglycan DL-endopeptidase CwlO
VVRLPPSPKLRILGVISVTLMVGLSAPAATGQTSTSKQKEVQRLQDELDRLDDEASALAEDANAAQQELIDAQAALRDASDAAKESKSTYDQSLKAAKAEALRRLVEGPSMSIESTDTLQIRARRQTYREVANGQNIDRIDALNAATEDYSISRDKAKRLADKAKQQKAALNAALKKTNKLADRQDALLRNAKADVVKLLAQEEARRIKAEQRAAQAAAVKRKALAIKLLKQREQQQREEQRQAAARASNGRAPKLVVPPTSSNVRALPNAEAPGQPTAPPTAPPANDAALAAEADRPSNLPNASGADLAVQVALAQVGKAYVWGAAGTESFDCSGLTGYAWGKAGKQLPRVSRAQYAATRRVSRSEWQPGDLLFFAKPGRPIHHVGMYIGNGQMVEAPHRRARVRVRSALRRDYFGAGRVL